MPNILTNNRTGVGPHQYRNLRWGFDADDANGAFDEAEVYIALDRLTPPSLRVELTQLSEGVTATTTTISVDQSEDWVSDNLPAGRWRCVLAVDGYELANWTFDVIEPTAGPYAPAGGSL